MSISSINSNLAALYAQQNISNANTATANDVSALSSGNRIVNASTDVAALAIGTALQGQVSTLNTVVSSLSQGSSLLQVADGGLAQIQTILQRQQAIATEAQSGSLSSTQLGFLNQEFQALTAQVDSLAGTTNFNGVNLLNGGIQGGTTIATNTAAGSTTTAPAATIATISTNTFNTDLSTGTNTFTLAVAGQPSVTLTFGNGAGQVAVGATAQDTISNLAAALNNSGLTELADLRFGVSSASTANNASLQVYYTGSASAITDIPSVTSSAAVNSAGSISATGLASFSAATAIGTFSGVLNTGDSITIGSHVIDFDPYNTNGTTAGSAYLASSTPPVVDLGNTGSVTSGALANLAGFLNSVAGSTGYTDLSGITFSSSATQLIATYTGSSATPPTISTSYTSATPDSLNTSGTAQGDTAATAVLTFTGGNNSNGDFVQGSTLVIGGQTVTFGTSSDVAIGANITATLASLATYLNGSTVNSALSTAYKGDIFSSDGSHLYANNTTTTAETGSSPTVATTFATAASVPSGDTGFASATVASGATATFLNLASGNLTAGSTITIGSDTITLIAAGETAVQNLSTGQFQVVVGANAGATATAIATFINAEGVSNVGFASGSSLTIAASGTIITGVASALTSAEVVTLGEGANADITPFTSSGTIGVASDVAAFSGNINAGDTITVGGTTITVVASTATPGADQIAQGATLNATLLNLAHVLNYGSATGTTISPLVTNTFFGVSGGELLAQDSAGAAGTVTVTYTPLSNPTFTGVVGANLAAVSSIGLGAGTTSAVGTPSGNLFVTDSGQAASVTNYGNAVDLSGVANNSDFVGVFGGSGTIGAITGTYVNTGTNSTSGVQFSTVVGGVTYTTGTIKNSSLDSTTAPVSLLFTGTSNNAPAGGTFTLTLQGNQAQVTDQTEASQLATGINNALSTVSAYQNRSVVSYNNNYSAEVGGTETATLQGSSLTFNSADFSNPLISSVSVTAPSTGSTDAKISVIVNGSTFSTIAGIGDKFAANSTITLENSANPNQTLTLTTGPSDTVGGSYAIDLSSASNAAAFQTALSDAVGLNNAGAGLTFQAGTSTSSTIGVSLGSATSQSLFGGVSLDVSSQGDATTAYNALTGALNTISSLRATVGALEERFNYATSALQNASQNEGAAQSNLLDTDVAATSTQFATSQVQLQAGIAVLAQANQLQQNLLKLIQ